MFGHDIITRLILATLLPGFLVTCHQGALHAREYGYREPLHAGEYGFREPPENDTSLAKRTIWDLTDMTGGDKSVVIVKRLHDLPLTQKTDEVAGCFC